MGGYIAATDISTTYDLSFTVKDGSDVTKKTYIIDDLSNTIGQDTYFSFTILTSDLNPTSSDWTFLGPHLLTITDNSDSSVTSVSWNITFYYPAYNILSQVLKGNYIRVTNAGTSTANGNTIFMQEFTSQQCDSWPTVTGTDYSNPYGKFSENPELQPFYLADSRDGKRYEIRKFSDGHCWLAQNLAYGGDNVDGCLGKSTFDGSGTGSTSTGASKYGYWTNGTTPVGSDTPITSTNQLYGDCRDAAATGNGDVTYCATGEGKGKCGYLYNWQAALQSPNAYYKVSFQPAEPTQGVCPAGWHLPSSIEFCNLDKAVYNKASCSSYTFDNNFYQPYSTANPNGHFNGLYSGIVEPLGSSSIQNTYADYWSSTQYNIILAYYLGVNSNGRVGPQNYNDRKYLGFSVRCLKD